MLEAEDETPKLTIAELQTILISYTTRSQDSAIEDTETADAVSAINHVQQRYGKREGRSGSNKTGFGEASGRQAESCSSCGDSHARHTCRFHRATCSFCHKKGHIKKACRCMRNELPKSCNAPAVHGSSLNESSQIRGRAFAKVSVNSIPVKFRVDTGADLTTIGTDI